MRSSGLSSTTGWSLRGEALPAQGREPCSSSARSSAPTGPPSVVHAPPSTAGVSSSTLRDRAIRTATSSARSGTSVTAASPPGSPRGHDYEVTGTTPSPLDRDRRTAGRDRTRVPVTPSPPSTRRPRTRRPTTRRPTSDAAIGGNTGRDTHRPGSSTAGSSSPSAPIPPSAAPTRTISRLSPGPCRRIRTSDLTRSISGRCRALGLRSTGGDLQAGPGGRAARREHRHRAALGRRRSARDPAGRGRPPRRRRQGPRPAHGRAGADQLEPDGMVQSARNRFTGIVLDVERDTFDRHRRAPGRAAPDRVAHDPRGCRRARRSRSAISRSPRSRQRPSSSRCRRSPDRGRGRQRVSHVDRICRARARRGPSRSSAAAARARASASRATSTTTTRAEGHGRDHRLGRGVADRGVRQDRHRLQRGQSGRDGDVQLRLVRHARHPDPAGRAGRHVRVRRPRQHRHVDPGRSWSTTAPRCSRTTSW